MSALDLALAAVLGMVFFELLGGAFGKRLLHGCTKNYARSQALVKKKIVLLYYLVSSGKAGIIDLLLIFLSAHRSGAALLLQAPRSFTLPPLWTGPGPNTFAGSAPLPVDRFQNWR
jgi:hypothetical protein